MSEISETNIKNGEEVVRATGELSATAKDAVKAVTESGVDHQEVQSWITTILKAIFAAIKL